MIDEAAKLERANLYREMMNTWAFKDFMSRVRQEKDDNVAKVMSQKGAENLEWTKGFVACQNFMENELSFVTEFKK